MHTSNYKHITGTGDDGDVYGKPCHLRSVVVGVPLAAGTMSIHDCVNAAAAAPENMVSTIALDIARDFVFSDAAMTVGLVAIVSGATDVTILWG